MLVPGGYRIPLQTVLARCIPVKCVSLLTCNGKLTTGCRLHVRRPDCPRPAVSAAHAQQQLLRRIRWPFEQTATGRSLGDAYGGQPSRPLLDGCDCARRDSGVPDTTADERILSHPGKGCPLFAYSDRGAARRPLLQPGGQAIHFLPSLRVHRQVCFQDLATYAAS